MNQFVKMLFVVTVECSYNTIREKKVGALHLKFKSTVSISERHHSDVQYAPPEVIVFPSPRTVVGVTVNPMALWPMEGAKHKKKNVY